MTLPSIIQDKQAKERVAQLKKVYSILSQAHMQAVSEKGTPDEWGMKGMYDKESHYIFATTLRPYLKLSKDCIDMQESKVYKECDPEDLSSFVNARSVILIDGTRLTFRIYNGMCTSNYSGTSGSVALQNTCGGIRVDLNGKKGPNKNGEDRFRFYFTKSGIIPYGIKNSSIEFEKACNKKIENPYPDYSSDSNMYACAAWVLYNENMDYLHCDDLSWGKKTRCK